MKETYTREEVIEMLKKMQIATADCNSFVVGMVTQVWVIKNLLGNKIEELGGESIEIKMI